MSITRIYCKVCDRPLAWCVCRTPLVVADAPKDVGTVLDFGYKGQPSYDTMSNTTWTNNFAHEPKKKVGRSKFF